MIANRTKKGNPTRYIERLIIKLDSFNVGKLKISELNVSELNVHVVIRNTNVA